MSRALAEELERIRQPLRRHFAKLAEVPEVRSSLSIPRGTAYEIDMPKHPLSLSSRETRRILFVHPDDLEAARRSAPTPGNATK